jgi:hypothetical protein
VAIRYTHSKSHKKLIALGNRGKADCGDIDILITRPTYDRKDHRGACISRSPFRSRGSRRSTTPGALRRLLKDLRAGASQDHDAYAEHARQLLTLRSIQPES